MQETLTISHKDKVSHLVKILSDMEDGELVVGNGKEIIHHDITPLKHSFADQVYIRQMDMKKGTIVVGAIHKHLHVWFLLTGKLTVATKNGIEDFISPCYVVSQPGSQRVIYADEDSIFVNIHKNPTNTTNIEKLEKEIVALNKEEYEEYINQKI
tara:strand:- start:1694 stop:2158 length:465 start_codon:yes stop_codon:yes gene_type:complete